MSLDGRKTKGALFGYAMAVVGDLNRDGFPGRKKTLNVHLTWLGQCGQIFRPVLKKIRLVLIRALSLTNNKRECGKFYKVREKNSTSESNVLCFINRCGY